LSIPRNIEPVIRICAVIGGSEQILQSGIQRLENHWGPIFERSDPIPFEAGGFYRPSMGASLQKVLVASADFCDPSELADWKIQSNLWEQTVGKEMHQRGFCSNEISRPINLDPGYLTQAKLVLATIKDRDHRIYLRDQIFAEVTLNYVGKQWTHHRWTYPSYRTEAVRQFAIACRDRLRKHILENDLTRKG